MICFECKSYFNYYSRSQNCIYIMGIKDSYVNKILVCEKCKNNKTYNILINDSKTYIKMSYKDVLIVSRLEAIKITKTKDLNGLYYGEIRLADIDRDIFSSTQTKIDNDFNIYIETYNQKYKIKNIKITDKYGPLSIPDSSYMKTTKFNNTSELSYPDSYNFDYSFIATSSNIIPEEEFQGTIYNKYNNTYSLGII